MKKFLFLIAISFALSHQSLNAQWTQDKGPAGIVFSFAASTDGTGGTNLFAGTNQYGVFLSKNDSTKWTQVNKGLFNGSARALAVSDTTLFAAVGPLYLSNYNNISWKSTVYPGQDVQSLAVSDTNVFLGTYISGVFRSSDNGKSWTEVNSGLTDSALYTVVLFASDTFLFAGTWGGGAYRSTDNGTSWKEINNGITSHVHSFAIAPDGAGGTYLFAGTYFGKGVYRSSNFGDSWEAVDSGLTSNKVRSLAIHSNGLSSVNLFAGTDGGGVFLSTDNGNYWTPFNTGMTSNLVNGLIVHGSHLFAGTGNGVWRRPLSDVLTTSVKQINSENINGEFGLEQNYPNPFNSSTKIRYQVPALENVTIKVYDMLGKEVSCLVSEKKQAGSYEVQFEAKDLLGGIYFYKLHAGKYGEIKKMTLLK